MQFKLLSVVDGYSKDFDGDQHDRECLDCDIQNGRATPGTAYSCFSCGPAEFNIVCIECRKAERSFCEGCRTCTRCLEGRRAEICDDCGWCDICVMLKTVDWEERAEHHNEGEGPSFEGEGAYKHHLVEYCKGYCKALSSNRELKVCTECFQMERNICNGCRTCTLCLNERYVDICADCGWCDICVASELERWESREEFHEEDDGSGIEVEKAYMHHF